MSLNVGNWAVAKKFAMKNNYSIHPRSEMIGYALCNIFGSLFRSYVVAGGFARSAVNAGGGAQSPFAGFVSGVCILFSLQFFTTLFYYLPLATLGAIIVVSVVTMMDFEILIFVYRKGFYQDFVVILGTALCTFFGGVMIGLLCGIALSVGGLLYVTSSSQFVMTLHPSREYICREKLCDVSIAELSDPKTFCVMKMSSCLYFGNIENFKESLQSAADMVIESFIQQENDSQCKFTQQSMRLFGAVVVDASRMSGRVVLHTCFPSFLSYSHSPGSSDKLKSLLSFLSLF